MRSTETIFALATGRLPSGIAIIRVSGPAARDALTRIAGSVPASRRALYTTFKAGEDLLDTGLALFFPGPGSATGEDCAEFHIHGSLAVAAALSAALSAIPGVRPAEPGEFTQRGFLNGRMDLTGVESLSDLIAAETDQQRRQAITGVSGLLRDMCLGWRRRLQTLRVRIEADLDFSDQEDVTTHSSVSLGPDVTAILGEMDEVLARVGQAEIVRSGYRIVIVGAPNAGKSSLLNALAMRDVAIVTPEPGTTRDIVEVALDLDGYKVVLQDTAGLRETDAIAERMGIARARAAAGDANLVLLVQDGQNPVDIEVETEAPVLTVGNKADLGSFPRDLYDVRVSATSGEGLGDLLSEIRMRIAREAGDGSALPIRARHVGHIVRARGALQNTMLRRAPELVAEELRIAAEEIGRIVGIGDTEALLGEIFSRFCIGK